MFSVAVSGAIVTLLGNDTFMKLVSLPTDAIANIAMAISPAATTADLTGASAAQTGEVVANMNPPGLAQAIAQATEAFGLQPEGNAADAVDTATNTGAGTTVGPGMAATLDMSVLQGELSKITKSLDAIARNTANTVTAVQ